MVAFAENKVRQGTRGYRYDAETQNYYVRNRYYLPTLGRWLTRDPIGYQGGINLYAYVASSPVGNVDPAGLASSSGCLAGVLANFRKAVRKDLAMYNGVVGALQLAQAERGYARADAATANFLKGSLVSVTGLGIASGIQVAADSMAAENAATQLAVLEQTSQAFNAGLASAEDVAFASLAASRSIGLLNSVSTAARLSQPVLAAATGALAAWASGEQPLNGEGAVQALLSVLPDADAVLPTVLDQAAAGLLLQAELNGGSTLPGAGRAFWNLNREIQLAKKAAMAAAARCPCGH